MSWEAYSGGQLPASLQSKLQALSAVWTETKLSWTFLLGILMAFLEALFSPSFSFRSWMHCLCVFTSSDRFSFLFSFFFESLYPVEPWLSIEGWLHVLNIGIFYLYLPFQLVPSCQVIFQIRLLKSHAFLAYGLFKGSESFYVPLLVAGDPCRFLPCPFSSCMTVVSWKVFLAPLSVVCHHQKAL